MDLLLSLGDYVYDTGYADGVYVPGRDDPVQDALTVDDFRSKYRLYRSDPNLQDVHALYPVVGIFDNHDGLTQPGDPQEPGALRAFAEYMPARGAPTGPLYRSLAWGDMADLLVTDQRSYRDGNLQEDGPLGTSTATIRRSSTRIARCSERSSGSGCWAASRPATRAGG
ncbi:MAG: alkaline phosphatase D family protein [Microthrixaceae bacterium]